MAKPRTALIFAVVAVLAIPGLAACAPSPADMCGHLVGLMKAELGEEVDAMSAEQLEKIEAGCVADAKADRDAGAKDFTRRAECVMAAQSLDEVRECERSDKAKQAD